MRWARPPALRGSRWRTLAPRIALVLGVAAAAVAAAALYDRYGRPADEQVGVLTTGAATPRATPVVLRGMESTGTPAAPTPTPAPPALGDATLLRPGTELIARYDVSLDGRSPTEVAASSRYTVTDGCGQLYADLYAYRGGEWRRVYAADDPAMAYGPLLSAPEQGDSGCFPVLKLFGAQQGAGAGYLILGAVYADTSVRLQVVGWDAATDAPAILFDYRSGTNGRLDRSVSGDRIDVSEDAMAPGLDGQPIVVGRFTQTVTLTGGAATVTGRRLAPNCDRGKVAGAPAALAGALTVLLTCSDDSHVALTVDETTELLPSGVGWENIEDGDTVQVQYDPVSLTPASAGTAALTAISLSDNAAGTRKARGVPVPRASATRQPSAPTGSGRGAPAPPAAPPAAGPAP